MWWLIPTGITVLAAVGWLSVLVSAIRTRGPGPSEAGESYLLILFFVFGAAVSGLAWGAYFAIGAVLG